MEMRYGLCPMLEGFPTLDSRSLLLEEAPCLIRIMLGRRRELQRRVALAVLHILGLLDTFVGKQLVEDFNFTAIRRPMKRRHLVHVVLVGGVRPCFKKQGDNPHRRLRARGLAHRSKAERSITVHVTHIELGAFADEEFGALEAAGGVGVDLRGRVDGGCACRDVQRRVAAKVLLVQLLRRGFESRGELVNAAFFGAAL